MVCRDAGRDTVCVKGIGIKTDQEEMKVNGTECVQKYLELFSEAAHV